MMTAPNVLAVSNWITELKLLMLILHEQQTGTTPNVALVTQKQLRVVVPWELIAPVVEARAKFLVDACRDAGVDENSLQQEIVKYLPPTTQSGG